MVGLESCVWTPCLVLLQLGLTCMRMFLEVFCVDRSWRHLDLTQLGHGNGVGCCRGFCSVPGPLQLVQRAELWIIIFAIQAVDAVHVEVVRHVGRIFDDSRPIK